MTNDEESPAPKTSLRDTVAAIQDRAASLVPSTAASVLPDKVAGLLDALRGEVRKRPTTWLAAGTIAGALAAWLAAEAVNGNRSA